MFQTIKKKRRGLYRSGQGSDFLNDLIGTYLRPNLNIEDPREEERVTHVSDELPDLIRLNRDEPLVSPVLPILLLEYDRRDSARFALFRRYVLAGI